MPRQVGEPAGLGLSGESGQAGRLPLPAVPSNHEALCYVLSVAPRFPLAGRPEALRPAMAASRPRSLRR